VGTSVLKAAGTGGSLVVERCQACAAADLESILFMGFLPPVNTMRPIGQRPQQEWSYPAELLRCRTCELVQLGLVVDASVLFPPEYPYTSGTTRILRENFRDLARECGERIGLDKSDLVIDVGSNDGTLLSSFAGRCRLLGIEPTQAADLALKAGIPTIKAFFGAAAVERALAEQGRAKIVTATNVFAHIEQVGEVIANIRRLLGPGGVFISESHYLLGLVETLQFDTIYHEHLRYYSLTSLKNLLERHEFEVFHVKRIPTHGGSIRVYATERGARPVDPSVSALLAAEQAAGLFGSGLHEFRRRTVLAKLRLHGLLTGLVGGNARIFGVGAPSRASTLINYVGLGDGILQCVVEVKGSHKIGKYMPGTLIPVVEEQRLFDEQPEYALLLSWHIADELIPKLKEKGFRGRFIVPLPEPRVVEA
jgi:hypothetical protein